MTDTSYDAPQDHRVLQISSAFDIADGRRVHESRLGSNEAEIRETLEVRPDWEPGTAVLRDGHISIQYRGHELLGHLWWIQFIALTALSPLIEKGRSTQTLNNSSGQFVEFEQSGASVAMRLHDHGNVRSAATTGPGFSKRLIGDTDYQQGHEEYFLDILREMKARQDAVDDDALRVIRDAALLGELDYVLVTTQHLNDADRTAVAFARFELPEPSVITSLIDE